MHLMKTLIFSVMIIYLELHAACTVGEHFRQGTNTCVPGNISSEPSIFLENCPDGKRTMQGHINGCVVTTPIEAPILTLPICPYRYRLTQGTNECVEKFRIIKHNNAAGGNDTDRGSGITLDNLGNMYITGYSTNSSGNFDMVIWKYKNDGTLDTTFDSDGIVVHQGAAGGDGDDIGYDITSDSLGNIYVTGVSTNVEGNKDMTIWKYASDGSLDMNFGSGGIVIHKSAAGANGRDRGRRISLDSVGNIFISGFSRNLAQNDDIVIWKYTSDGTLDNNFGSDGIVIQKSIADSSNTNSTDIAYGMILDTSDNIYITGFSQNIMGNNDMVILKYTSDGILDNSFDSDGIVVHHNAAGGNGNDYGSDIILDNFGNIYITGYSTNSTGYRDTVIWKYKSDGNLDATFGSDGIVVQASATGGNKHDNGTALALDNVGNLYVSGYSTNSANNYDMVILKYKSNGHLDTTFDSDGIAVWQGISGGDDSGSDIILDNSGNVLITGFSGNIVGDDDMAIWKYEF